MCIHSYSQQQLTSVVPAVNRHCQTGIALQHVALALCSPLHCRCVHHSKCPNPVSAERQSTVEHTLTKQPTAAEQSQSGASQTALLMCPLCSLQFCGRLQSNCLQSAYPMHLMPCLCGAHPRGGCSAIHRHHTIPGGASPPCLSLSHLQTAPRPPPLQATD